MYARAAARDWRLIEWPEPPQTFPEPGTTRFDSELESRLHESDEFERLRQLLGAYFHQDFDVEFGDEEDAVRAYVQGYAHRPEVVVELLHAMDTLLALGLSGTDLKRALDVLGSDYYPLTDTTSWLCTLRAQVLAEARGD